MCLLLNRLNYPLTEGIEDHTYQYIIFMLYHEFVFLKKIIHKAGGWMYMHATNSAFTQHIPCYIPCVQSGRRNLPWHLRFGLCLPGLPSSGRCVTGRGTGRDLKEADAPSSAVCPLCCPPLGGPLWNPRSPSFPLRGPLWCCGAMEPGPPFNTRNRIWNCATSWNGCFGF